MAFSPDIGSGGAGRETILLSGSPFDTLASLESYSQANPTELLNNSSKVALAVVTTDPTPDNNGTYEYTGPNQSYLAGRWVKFSGLDASDIKNLYESNANTNAFTDADNTTVSMTQALTPNSIPIATTGGLVDGPIRDMGDRLMVDKDTQFPAGSLLLDDILRVSEQTGFIGITNNVTNARFTVLDGRHDRTTGSYRPNQFFLTAAQSQQVLQPNDSVQITSAEFSFNYTSTLQGQTNIIEFKTYAALTNVRLRITDTVSGVPFKHVPNRAAWDSETGGIDFPTVGDNEYDLSGSELRLSPGRQLTIDVKADQAGFLGVNQATPYFAIQFQPAEFRGMAFDSQIDPLFDSVTLNQGKITFGSAGGGTSTISSSTLDRVFKDFGQGNSGGVITTNSVAGAYYEISDDAKNASAFNITDSLDNDVYFNMDLSKVTEDLTLTITQANSEFSDGSTSLTLRHNHVLIAFCQRDVPTVEPSPTNPNVVYTMQVAVSGSAGPAITPDFENTVVVGANGDDSLDGKNLHTMVQTLGRALTLAGGFPSGEHKLIYSIGENNLGNLTNSATVNNVTNLNIFAPHSTFGTVDLSDHATSLVCRRLTGGITIGDQCKINVDGVIGNVNPSIILFNAEVHEATEIKCQRLESNVGIDFSSVSTGSHIRIEIDRFDGSQTNLNTILSTIPSGVTVTGWIGDVTLPVSVPELNDIAGLPIFFRSVESLLGTFTVVGDGRNMEFVTGVAVVAHRQGVSESLQISNESLINGRSTFDLTFTQTDITNLKQGTGDIELRFTFSKSGIVNPANDHLVTILEDFGSQFQLTSSRSFTSDGDYASLDRATFASSGSNTVTFGQTTLRFHCYFVCSSGDLTLQTLSGVTLFGHDELTAGDVVRIDSLSDTQLRSTLVGNFNQVQEQIKNGVPTFDSLVFGKNGNPNSNTQETMTIRALWSGVESLTLSINGVDISSFATTASNLDGGEVHVINYTISSTEWNSIYSSSPSFLNYQLKIGFEIIYANLSNS